MATSPLAREISASMQSVVSQDSAVDGETSDIELPTRSTSRVVSPQSSSARIASATAYARHADPATPSPHRPSRRGMMRVGLTIRGVSRDMEVDASAHGHHAGDDASDGDVLATTKAALGVSVDSSTDFGADEATPRTPQRGAANVATPSPLARSARQLSEGTPDNAHGRKSIAGANSVVAGAGAGAGASVGVGSSRRGSGTVSGAGVGTGGGGRGDGAQGVVVAASGALRHPARPPRPPVTFGSGARKDAKRRQQRHAHPQIRRVQFMDRGAMEPSPMDDELFNTADEHCTPQIEQEELKFKPPSQRAPTLASQASTVARPDYDDFLLRIAVVLYQHIVRSHTALADGLPLQSAGLLVPTAASRSQMRQASRGLGMTRRRSSASDASDTSDDCEPNITEIFHESLFVKPRFRYTFIRAPRGGASCYKMEKVKPVYTMPTVNQIYNFAKHLFIDAQLSAECSIVCLVYIERLMKNSGLLLLSNNWRPVLICGLLLASKLWQDLSSWNVEFSQVYPQFPLASINRLEREFVQALRWDFFISGSLYAKYYFALRAMSERKNFRRRYMLAMKVHAPGSKRIASSSRTLQAQLYSKSL